MESSLSNLVNNLAEGVHKIKCKYKHDDKNVKRPKLNTKIVSAVLNTRVCVTRTTEKSLMKT